MAYFRTPGPPRAKLKGGPGKESIGVCVWGWGGGGGGGGVDQYQGHKILCVQQHSAMILLQVLGY